LANSNLRFQQWIQDTCLRPYDQDWINYQHEIALRHTSLKKNKVDGVRSTPYVPLRDVIAFIAVMNETIKPYLAAKGNSAEEVDRMAIYLLSVRDSSSIIPKTERRDTWHRQPTKVSSTGPAITPSNRQ
jgi:hypothetical protein